MNEIRITNLKKLIEEYGSQEALAHVIGVTPGYLSQISNATRPFNEKTADKWEAKLKLPAKWFSVDHDGNFSEQELIAAQQAHQDMQMIKEQTSSYDTSFRDKLDSLSPADKALVESLIDRLLSAK